MKKRVSAILLALIMAMGLLPGVAAAKTSNATLTVVIRVRAYNPSTQQHEFFTNLRVSTTVKVEEGTNPEYPVSYRFEKGIKYSGSPSDPYYGKEGYKLIVKIGDTELDTANAWVFDHDMSNVSGSGQTFHPIYTPSSGQYQNMLYISGGTPLPDPGPTKPEAPGENDLPSILGNDVVQVDCINDKVNHETKHYGLKTGSYTIGKVAGDATGGYTCDITINSAAPYVEAYNADMGIDHTLSPAGEQAPKTITLTWDEENGWQKPAQGLPILFTVICEAEAPAPEAPKPPTEDDLSNILGDAVVEVECVNEDAGHAKQAYALIADSYTIGEVAGDATSGYTCDITINAAPYVEAYNADMGIDHTLSPEAQTPKTITLTWDGEKSSWTVQPDALPILFTVICEAEAPAPEAPKPPTEDEILALLGDAKVKVICTPGRHGTRIYALRADSIRCSDVYESDGQFYLNVTLSGQPYVQAYSRDTGRAHTLSDPAAYTITLVWSDGWHLQEESVPVYAFHAACTAGGGDSGGWYPPSTGSLTVTKTMADGNRSRQFTFVVTLNRALNGVYGGMRFENGVATFTLGHGQSVRASGLPVGTTYTVEEIGNAGYQAIATGNAGSITWSGATASFQNIPLSIPSTGDMPRAILGATLIALSLLGLAVYHSRKSFIG